jgi:hypothetical protein
MGGGVASVSMWDRLLLITRNPIMGSSTYGSGHAAALIVPELLSQRPVVVIPSRSPTSRFTSDVKPSAVPLGAVTSQSNESKTGVPPEIGVTPVAFTSWIDAAAPSATDRSMRTVIPHVCGDVNRTVPFGLTPAAQENGCTGIDVTQSQLGDARTFDVFVYSVPFVVSVSNAPIGATPASVPPAPLTGGPAFRNAEADCAPPWKMPPQGTAIFPLMRETKPCGGDMVMSPTSRRFQPLRRVAGLWS